MCSVPFRSPPSPAAAVAVAFFPARRINVYTEITPRSNRPTAHLYRRREFDAEQKVAWPDGNDGVFFFGRRRREEHVFSISVIDMYPREFLTCAFRLESSWVLD